MSNLQLAAEGAKIVANILPVLQGSDKRAKVYEQNETARHRDKMEWLKVEKQCDTAAKVKRIEAEVLSEELDMRRNASNRCFSAGFYREGAQVIGSSSFGSFGYSRNSGSSSRDE